MSSSVIRPRQVEPKAIRRWFKLAFLLMNRNRVTWLIVSFGFGLLALGLCFSLLLSTIVIATLFLSGTLLAMTVDATERPPLRHQVTIFNGGILPAFRQAVGVIVGAFLIIGLGNIFMGNGDFLLNSLFDISDLTNESSDKGMRNTLRDWASPSAIALAFSIGFMLLPIFGQGPFHYLLRHYFSIDRDSAGLLVIEGLEKNLNSLLHLEFVLVFFISLATELLPGLSVMVIFAMCCSVCWVAFKDIFLHQNSIEEMLPANSAVVLRDSALR